MKVLVTGANGFVAKHLLNELTNRKYNVFATSHSSSNNNNVYLMDLNDKAEIKNIINIIKPDVIIHLAAQSNVSKSWKNPSETIQINTIGTLNIIQVVDELDLKTKLVLIGSSEEYGETAKFKSILSEEDICLPQNPYAVSKYATSQLALQYAKRSNLEIIYLRPFNHFGIGQKKGFVVSDFCSQVARIEIGEIEPKITVGNLSTYRDFLPIEDIINAYLLVTENRVPSGIYNISSGKPISIKSILYKILDLSTVKIEIKYDNNLFRPVEVKSFAGDNKKFMRVTGWKPVKNLDDSLIKTLNWWRKLVGG